MEKEAYVHIGPAHAHHLHKGSLVSADPSGSNRGVHHDGTFGDSHEAQELVRHADSGDTKERIRFADNTRKQELETWQHSSEWPIIGGKLLRLTLAVTTIPSLKQSAEGWDVEA